MRYANPLCQFVSKPVKNRQQSLLLQLPLLLSLFSSSVFAAALPATDPLHQELAQQDATFFQRGFNQCDLDYLQQAISANLMFYHDQSGVQDKTVFMANTKKYLCGDPAHKPIRKLTEGSLSTFPLYQNGELYGAIQQGLHEFYLREPGKPDRLTGKARFHSVWLLTSAKGEPHRWQLTDVHSYDHQPVLEH